MFSWVVITFKYKLQLATPRRRGPNVNRQVVVPLAGAIEGSEIDVILDEESLKFIYQLTWWFATECLIVIHSEFPMGCITRIASLELTNYGLLSV